MTSATTEVESTPVDRTITGIAVSPDVETDGTIFAAAQNGLRKSTVGGQTWADAFETIPAIASTAVSAIAISPQFRNDGTVIVAIIGGIGRTDDRGGTWTFARLPPPAPYVTALAISPDADFVFAATLQDGIFRSEDACRTWTSWNFGLLDFSVQVIAVSPAFERDQTVFAGTSTGLMRSTNAGRSWQAVDLPVEMPTITAIAQAGPTVICGTEGNGLFASSDGGVTWEAFDSASIQAMTSIGAALTASGRREFIALSNAGLAISRDGGRTWTLPEIGSDTPKQLTCATFASETVIIAGDNDGKFHRIVIPD